MKTAIEESAEQIEDLQDEICYLQNAIRERDAEIAKLKARLAISREMTLAERDARLRDLFHSQGWTLTTAFDTVVCSLFAEIEHSKRMVVWHHFSTDDNEKIAWCKGSIERAEAAWVEMYGEFK